eukprot:SAG31_NODE_7857_length_1582_cov_1.264329_1_plen_80_part_10
MAFVLTLMGNVRKTNPSLCHSTYGTAVSAQIDGPFELHTIPVVMGASQLRPVGHQHGDFGLFVDEGTPDAYIVYNSYDAG